MVISSSPSSTGTSRTRVSDTHTSHRSDQQEFCQLLSYKDVVDLEATLMDWENFYNFTRPHGAFGGKTPYEALRVRLSLTNQMSR